MTQPRRYRIGAIHALMNAIPTTQTAFDRNWSAADVAPSARWLALPRPQPRDGG